MRAQRVIVAGAGLAGLTAARELARARVTVTLLDARERVGGRVHTERRFADGMHAERGGEFIEPKQKEVVALCHELGLPLVRVLRGGFTHRFRGNDGEPHVSRSRPWVRIAACLEPLVRQYRAAGGRTSASAVREMATLSLREWLRQRDATTELHSMANALRGFFLADPDDVSVLPVVEQIVAGGSPAQAELHCIEGGNDRLPEALARSTDARVLLRHRLVAIDQPTEHVVATVHDEQGHQQQIEADAIVVTLPASTLRDVDIRPALPDDQARAVRALRYGCATKVLLQSDGDAFCGRRARAFATDTALGAFWDGAEGQKQLEYSILTFLGGGSASESLAARASHGAQLILSDLCWLGMAGASAEAMHVASWDDDPFAHGGYAYMDPGFDPAWRDLLPRRAGRIFFAGEHTSERWQGYMNGAVETGQRAAREILESQ